VGVAGNAQAYTWKVTHDVPAHLQGYGDWWLTGGPETWILSVKNCADEIDLTWYPGLLTEQLMACPVANGVTWNAGYDTNWIWEDVGTVTVPAGTFENCWRKNWSVDKKSLFEIWCKGVGKVRNENRGDVWELAGTNFIPWAAPIEHR